MECSCSCGQLFIYKVSMSSKKTNTWYSMKMKVKKSSVAEKIFLLEFETQNELASTFIRFQEHYESPEFKGKIFSLDEYKRWYTEIKGSFSYYTDWSGFNIPSYILDPFKEGKFDPLTLEEQSLLDLFKNVEHPFYIIGVYGDSASDQKLKTVRHEIAHGLFYTNPEYRDKILNVLSKYNLDEFKEWLRSLGGYHESVLDDEVHAFTLTGSDKMKIDIPAGMKEEIEVIFSSFYK